MKEIPAHASRTAPPKGSLARAPHTCAILMVALLTATGAATASGPQPQNTTPAAPQAIQPPLLKWQRGGCYSSWCETGWYSSPAVADLDGDGKMEVIAAAYSLFVLDGATGSPKWHVDPPASGARAWPGVVVADLNGDGELEIVSAHGGGYVRVLDHAGNLLWTRRPADNELRSLAVYDLDGDGKLEVLVAVAVYASRNQWYVYQSDGTLRGGWPQLASGAAGYAAGCYNENIGVGDLDGDGRGEIVAPSDVHYITAYQRDRYIPTTPAAPYPVLRGEGLLSLPRH